MAFAAAASRSILRTPSPLHSINRRNSKKATTRIARIVAGVGGEDPDTLLETAVAAASLRFQESLRPDPLFIDPYAGCFFSPDPKDQCPISTPVLSPCHYRLATKFIDDKIVSLLSSSDELRQIVLLTDGMDTRPYRLSWPRSSVIYDISPGRVSKEASRRLEGVGAKISKNCVLLHVPLECSDLGASLHKKGFSGNRPSLWALQGLPLMTLTSFENILFTVSSLAMKGSMFIGELPGSLQHTEFEDMQPTLQSFMEKLFMSHGFQLHVVEYDEIARSLQLDSASGDCENALFIAKHLRLSDDQMEIWREQFERLEEEGDEEGFEEL